MRAPEFWHAEKPPGWTALLAPLSALWTLAARLRRVSTVPSRAGVPVLCVGNLTAGGSGKTPVALALAEWLTAQGHKPVFLSRGHGGRLNGPVRVDTTRHGARDVGDEPLLLARVAPVIVSGDRRKGAAAAIAEGADVIVMDDGFQNPTLAKTVSLIVVDGARGFGNGRVMPAGPLREPVADGLERAHGVIIVKRGTAGTALPEALAAARLPTVTARLEPDPESLPAPGTRVFAFAGIGDPAQFFAMLAANGLDVVDSRAFPDHHPYTESEGREILTRAAALDARPITTEKDAVRLPAALNGEAIIMRARLSFDDPVIIDRLLAHLWREKAQGTRRQ